MLYALEQYRYTPDPASSHRHLAYHRAFCLTLHYSEKETLEFLHDIFAPYTATHLIAIAAGVSLGALLQSASGFGFSLVAVPVMLNAGLPLPEVLVFSFTAQLWQQPASLWRVRRHVVWKPLVPVIITSLLFLVVGVILQKQLLHLDRVTVRRAIGALITLFLLAQALWRPEPREGLHPGWGLISGAFAGTSCGIAGIPGPPLVFWVMAHTWSNQRLRGSLWAIFLPLTPGILIVLAVGFRSAVLRALPAALFFIPASIIASAIGLSIGHKIPKHILRRIAYALLAALAAFAILGI